MRRRNERAEADKKMAATAWQETFNTSSRAGALEAVFEEPVRDAANARGGRSSSSNSNMFVHVCTVYLQKAIHVIGHLEDDVTYEGGVGFECPLRRAEVEEAPHAIYIKNTHAHTEQNRTDGTEPIRNSEGQAGRPVQQFSSGGTGNRERTGERQRVHEKKRCVDLSVSRKNGGRAAGFKTRNPDRLAKKQAKRRERERACRPHCSLALAPVSKPGVRYSPRPQRADRALGASRRGSSPTLAEDTRSKRRQKGALAGGACTRWPFSCIEEHFPVCRCTVR